MIVHGIHKIAEIVEWIVELKYTETTSLQVYSVRKKSTVTWAAENVCHDMLSRI